MKTIVIIEPERWARSPFQIYLLLLIGVSGIPLMLGVSQNAITKAMEDYLFPWGLALTIGSVLSLTGAYWSGEYETGMLIERIGLVALGCASLIWSVMIVLVVGWQGLFSASLTLGLGAACLAQIRYIDKNIRKIMKAIDEE